MYKSELEVLPMFGTKGEFVHYVTITGENICPNCANEYRESVVRTRPSSSKTVCATCDKTAAEWSEVKMVNCESVSNPIIINENTVTDETPDTTPENLTEQAPVVLAGSNEVQVEGTTSVQVLESVLESIKGDGIEVTNLKKRTVKCHKCGRKQRFAGVDGLDITSQIGEFGWSDDEDGDVCPVCAGEMTANEYDAKTGAVKTERKPRTPKDPAIARRHKQSCNMTDGMWDALKLASEGKGLTCSTILEHALGEYLINNGYQF